MGQEVLALVFTAVAGYLLGSINWSIILTWFFKNKEDIREYGSGNAGMTNVLRSVGKLPAVLTFVGDFLKCVVALLLSQAFVALLAPESVEFYDVARYVAGVACVLGHIFPIYYGFRGGKGVVTSAAMIALTDWRVFLLVLLTFAIVFASKRIVSLASVVCAALYPVYTFLFLFLVEFEGSPCQTTAPTAWPTCCSPRRPPCYRPDGDCKAQGEHRPPAAGGGKAHHVGQGQIKPPGGTWLFL